MMYLYSDGFALGESVDKPLRAVLGSALVMIGVGICVNSRDGGTEKDTQ